MIASRALRRLASRLSNLARGAANRKTVGLENSLARSPLKTEPARLEGRQPHKKVASVDPRGSRGGGCSANASSSTSFAGVEPARGPLYAQGWGGRVLPMVGDARQGLRGLAPRRAGGGGRAGGKGEADEDVPAGERQAKNAQGRLVAAHHVGHLQVLQEATAARPSQGIARRAGIGARPEFPFRAGVVGGKAGVGKKDCSDRRQQQGCQALAAARQQPQGQGQGGDRDIVGVALLKAEWAGRIAAEVFEGKCAQNRRHRQGQYRASDRKRGAQQGRAHGKWVAFRRGI